MDETDARTLVERAQDVSKERIEELPAVYRAQFAAVRDDIEA